MRMLNRGSFAVLLLVCVSRTAMPAPSIDDHRLEVKIDERVTIVPPESRLERAMLGMVRHADGSIFINLQTQQRLLRSSDEGRTWQSVPVALPEAPPEQMLRGLGVSRDGRLWLMHQSSEGKDLFVSVSEDAGQAWTTSRIDYPNLALGAPQCPYAFCYNDYNTFFERPDGTMVLGVGLRYEHWGEYQQEDQTQPGFHETLIRSTDGGETWGDPTEVHQHVAETCYAVDPENPDHILAMTRKQRMLLRDEDEATVAKEAGVPPGTAWPWKGAILLESTDGGRSFREVPGSYLGYYSHRGTILWTKQNVVVAPHTAAGTSDWRLVANISLDAGKTWVDGTQGGARMMNRAKDFVLVPQPPGFSFTTPTVALSPSRFLTVYCSGSPLAVKGLFWHIETPKRDQQGVSDPTARTPLRIGDERQLFVDDYLIETLDGVSKQLNQPTKHPTNPVLPMVPKGQPSWDTDMPVTFASVIYDEQEQLFKMWYGLWERGKGDASSVLCYATSKNGIDWHKPSLGILEYRGTKDNNVVMDHSGATCGVFKDLREADPAKRYKMLHMWRDYKVYASHSADGLHWTRYNQGRAAIFNPPGHDSHMVAYWDRSLGKYVAIIRDRTGRIEDVRKQLVTDQAAGNVWRQLWGRNRSPENHSIRRVAQAESIDFVRWSPVRCVLGADSADPLNRDQFYNMEVIPYEGIRIGLMTVFSYDPEYCRGAVQLTYSRDGMSWRRGGDRQIFLPLSDRPADFDWGSIYPVQGPLVIGDEIWIYYTGDGVDHNHRLPPGAESFPNGIGLAKLRLDGFVSMDAGAAEGTLTTKPFIFSGAKLMTNSDADEGHLLVEILDVDGEPFAGFGKQDCDAFEADEIRHTVTWQGNADVGALEGKVVKLRFYLAGAKLFSFGFRRR